MDKKCCFPALRQQSRLIMMGDPCSSGITSLYYGNIHETVYLRGNGNVWAASVNIMRRRGILRLAARAAGIAVLEIDDHTHWSGNLCSSGLPEENKGHNICLGRTLQFF